MRKFCKFAIALVACFFVGWMGYGCEERVRFDYEVRFMVDGEKYYSIGTDGKEIAMPRDPVKENMVFDGWYWDEGEWEKEFTLKSIAEQPLAEKNIYVIHAKWKGAECPVSFDYAGVEKATVNYDEPFELSVPEKEGYFFTGWYKGTDDASVQVTDEHGKGIGNWRWTEEVTLSPGWRVALIDVLFSSAYESLPFDFKQVNYGSAFGELPMPAQQEYEGFLFDGWYTAWEGGERVFASTVCEFTSDATLYARWTPRAYTLAFDYGEGEGDVASKQVTYREEIGELPVGRRTGYTFTGWYTQRGERLTPGTSYEYIENIRVYAGWEVKKVLVTFDFCGGHPSFDPSAKEYTSEVEFAAPYGDHFPQAEYRGYTLQGWYREREGGIPVAYEEACLDEDPHTLYAHWTITQVKVTFAAPGYDGELPEIYASFGEKIPALPWKIKRPGYILKAWRVSGYSDWFVDPDYVVEVEHNLDLVAEWEEYYEDAADGSLTYAKIKPGTCAYDFDNGLLCNLSENSIAVLDMKTKRLLHTFEFADSVISMDVCDGRLAVGLSTRKAEVFDLGDYASAAVVETQRNVTSVALCGTSLVVADEDHLIFYSLTSKQVYKTYAGVGVGCVRANRENPLVYHLQRDGDPVNSNRVLSSYAVESGEKLHSVALSASYYEDAFRVGGSYVYVCHDRFDALTLEPAKVSVSHSVPEEYRGDDFGNMYARESLSSLYLLGETKAYAFVYAQRQFRRDASDGNGEYWYNVIRVYDKKAQKYVGEAIMMSLEKWGNMSPAPYLNRFAFKNGQLFFYNENYAGLIDLR